MVCLRCLSKLFSSCVSFGNRTKKILKEKKSICRVGHQIHKTFGALLEP